MWSKQYLPALCIIISTSTNTSADILMLANVTITSTESTRKIEPSINSTSEKIKEPPPPIKISPSSENNHIPNTHHKINHPPVTQLLRKSKIKPHGTDTPSQYEFDGYVNGRYGHFFIEKANDNQFVGYWFDSKGNKKNINGVWVNNNLQVYENSGKTSSVVINSNDQKPTIKNPIESNQQLIENYYKNNPQMIRE